MIQVTHLNGSRFVLNSDLIEQIEETPDTVITLTNGKKVTLLESTEEIIQRIRNYRKAIFWPLTKEDSDRIVAENASGPGVSWLKK